MTPVILHWVLLAQSLVCAMLSAVVAQAESLIVSLLARWPELAPSLVHHSRLRLFWWALAAFWLVPAALWALLLVGWL